MFQLLSNFTKYVPFIVLTYKIYLLSQSENEDEKKCNILVFFHAIFLFWYIIEGCDSR